MVRGASSRASSRGGGIKSFLIVFIQKPAQPVTFSDEFVERQMRQPRAPELLLCKRRGVFADVVHRLHRHPSLEVLNLLAQSRELRVALGTRHLHADEALLPFNLEFAEHGIVNHSIGEYARDDAHTNTVEGYFSILKRGIYGVFHHVSSYHLHRYTTEFDFRYNHREKLGFNDSERNHAALKGISGKGLTYRRIGT